MDIKEGCTLSEIEARALKLVRRGQCQTRAELARALHVSRPTASSIVERLIDSQALCEVGLGKPCRGTTPVLLAPVEQFQYTIGIDLGYSKKIAGVLIDGQNHVVKKMEVDFDCTALESIRNKALALTDKLADGFDVAGVGIAVPGVIAPGTEKIMRSVNPVFTEYDFKELFSQLTQLPVKIENRSRAAAFSEACGGAGKLHDNFILCSLGKSIGATFWLNGAAFLGGNGAAGEIRCMRLPDGRTIEEALDFDKVEMYSEDELVAICAEGLNQLTEIMDLGLFILAGRFTDFHASFLKKINCKLSEHCQGRAVFSDYGRFSAARGAAISMSERILA